MFLLLVLVHKFANFNIRKIECMPLFHLKMEVKSLFDTYVLDKLLYQNDIISVYSGKTLLSEEAVILKRQPKDLENPGPNPFQKQMRINNKLIAHCNDVFEDLSFYYAVYTRPIGEPLLDILRKYGKLKEEKVAEIICQVLRAVDYLHDIGFALMEISISTVYYEEMTRAIQILDWNYTCSYGSERPYSQFPNPMQFSPPELYKDGQYLSSLADTWAVGILAHSLLSGNFPWGPIQDVELVPTMIVNPPSLPKNISTSCANFLQRTLEIESSRRYSIQQCLSHLWITKISKVMSRGKATSSQILNSFGSCSDFLRIGGMSSLSRSSGPSSSPGLKKIPRGMSLSVVPSFESPLSFDPDI